MATVSRNSRWLRVRGGKPTSNSPCLLACQKAVSLWCYKPYDDDDESDFRSDFLAFFLSKTKNRVPQVSFFFNLDNNSKSKNGCISRCWLPEDHGWRNVEKDASQSTLACSHTYCALEVERSCTCDPSKMTYFIFPSLFKWRGEKQIICFRLIDGGSCRPTNWAHFAVTQSCRSINVQEILLFVETISLWSTLNSHWRY